MSEGTITEDRILGHFQKSVNASILVSLVEWEGNDYLDIREVVPSNKPGEQFTFTRKGIRMSVELVDEFQGLLAKVPASSRETHGEGSTAKKRGKGVSPRKKEGTTDGK